MWAPVSQCLCLCAYYRYCTSGFTAEPGSAVLGWCRLSSDPITYMTNLSLAGLVSFFISFSAAIFIIILVPPLFSSLLFSSLLPPSSHHPLLNNLRHQVSVSRVSVPLLLLPTTASQPLSLGSQPETPSMGQWPGPHTLYISNPWFYSSVSFLYDLYLLYSVSPYPNRANLYKRARTSLHLCVSPSLPALPAPTYIIHTSRFRFFPSLFHLNLFTSPLHHLHLCMINDRNVSFFLPFLSFFFIFLMLMLPHL